jgi:hypothetical protein
MNYQAIINVNMLKKPHTQNYLIYNWNSLHTLQDIIIDFLKKSKPMKFINFRDILKNMAKKAVSN